MRLGVLVWNLKHGLAVPPAGRELFAEFAAALEGWSWQVALLQEVPPWWPAPLARRLGGSARRVLTSRNSLPGLRRRIATRRPDLIKSGGGGCNAILVRGAAELAEHRARRLCLLPERRWVHAVRTTSGMWFANLHTAASPAQGRAAAETVKRWAGGAPVVLGGDFNVAHLDLDGFDYAGGHAGSDHVYVSGFAPGNLEVLAHGRLSDHAPLLADVERA